MRKTFLTVSLLILLVCYLGSDSEVLAENDLNRDVLSADTAKAEQITKKISSIEVLAPLAPVALSPFFGITCLSGTSILCNRGILPQNDFLMGSDALNNFLVFAVFLVLAVATSIPKMTAVSKGFAQITDRLETYAGIISYLVIIYLASPSDDSTAQQVVFQAGIFSFTWNTLLMMAAVINIIVINTVKYFFELLVWISPIPSLDAAFEAANKVLAAILATVYAFNPFLAMILNIIVFLICLSIFNWAKRHVKYFRTIYLGPIIAKLFGKTDFSPSLHMKNKIASLVEQGVPIINVFPSRKIHKIKKKELCCLAAGKDGLFLVKFRTIFQPKIKRIEMADAQIEIRTGLFWNTIDIISQEMKKPLTLIFSRVYNQQIENIADSLKPFGKVLAESAADTQDDIAARPEIA
ncbi:MAG: hypothetical protein WCZ89_10380 [Phycisphaerae bacterium]